MNIDGKEFLGNDDIAIVGMSVCVPGAASAAQFWENLRDGVDSIQVLDEAALLDAGERADLIRHLRASRRAP